MSDYDTRTVGERLDDVIETWRHRFWRLRMRWAFRRSNSVVGTASLPANELHEDDTQEEAFRRSHGYARARVPMPQTDEQQAHNRALDEEYAAEIAHRKNLLQAGEYKARFYTTVFQPTAEELLNPDCVNWDMELTMEPGRRRDVTKETGIPLQPVITPDQVAERRAVDQMIAGLDRMQAGEQVITVRDLVGSRQHILDACHGNEAMADQVEQKARDTFGVTDLDLPLSQAVFKG
jgi:hypothetical protein